MKRFISILCALTLIASFATITANAEKKGVTELKLNEGDKVKYTLKLGNIEKPVLGCDFSIYYDKSTMSIDSFADFTNSTNEDDWECLVNTEADNEIIGNWSIIRGVDFSKERNMLTVNFTAKKDTTTNIRYFIRYLYDENVFNAGKKQIEKYTFKCDVSVNGTPVIENGNPELETETEQKQGTFVNSPTGDSADADTSIKGTVGNIEERKKNYKNTNNESYEVHPENKTNENTVNDNNDDKPNENTSSSSSKAEDRTEASEKESTIKETTPTENETTNETSAATTIATTDTEHISTPIETQNGMKTSPLVWIIPCVIVLVGGGVGFYFWKKKKM